MNHVIVGLGGTGGKVIRALRKLIYQEFRSEQPEGVSLGWLYVDSDAQLMGEDDESWKTLGISVQLPAASKLLITDANLAARLDDLASYPGIQPWIGEREQWRDILNSIVGVTLGGQKRRLGRFLFACKADRFREHLQTQVRRVQSNHNIDTTFHVICGLAGGTGSGSVVDALVQMRDLYPDAQRYRILAYVLLPDAYPPPNWDTGNYQANGYAALLELNALSAGAWRPHDVLGKKGRLALTDPFNGCYVFGNENENGLTVDVQHELPDIISEFLYQKIIRARPGNWPALSRMENAENGDGGPETAPSSRRGERSKRFLTFGIKRVAIPEEEISEYLGYGFARQALLQISYDNWQDALGYVEESKPFDAGAYVRQKDVQHRWAINEDHLLMNFPILSGDGQSPKWRPLSQEWDAVIPHFKSLVRELDRATWLDELDKYCERHWQENFRDQGVVVFFETKLKAKRDIARDVVLRIENELANEWRIGVRGMDACARIVTAVIELFDERLNGIGEQIAKARAGEEDAQNRLQQNKRAWASMGIIASLVGKRVKLLDAHAVYLRELYVYRTRGQALRAMQMLLQEILSLAAELKAEVDRADGSLRSAVERFGKRMDQRLIDGISGEGPDLRRHLIRYYEKDRVQAVARRLGLDADVQRTQAASARSALFGRFGEMLRFADFNMRVPLATLFDTLERTGEEAARLAHASLIRDAKERVLGVSIIERLVERYAADPVARRFFVNELVRQAGAFTALDPLETHRSAPGIPAGSPTAVTKLTVILPKTPEHADFVSALKQDFLAARSGDVELIDADGGDSEIVLVTIINLFPLRYLRPVAVLKERYERRLREGDTQRMRLELLTEGDGTQLPPLYVANPEEVRKEGLPYVLIARALGVLLDAQNPTTGEPEVLLLSKDADGFDNPPLLLGRTLTDSWAALDLVKLDTLRGHVTQLLAGPDWRHRHRREELVQSVLSSVETIRGERGNDMQDAQYLRFLDAGKQAARLLKGEGR